MKTNADQCAIFVFDRDHVPYSGTPLMNDFVPSIGSRIQLKPDEPAVVPNSSPMMPSLGKAAAIRSRSNCSADRSAIVTGEASLLLDLEVIVLKIPERQPPGFFAGEEARLLGVGQFRQSSAVVVRVISTDLKQKQAKEAKDNAIRMGRAAIPPAARFFAVFATFCSSVESLLRVAECTVDAMTNRQSLSSEAALDELRGRYAELAALAGSLAHEIKNPLSVIRMNMDLLAEDFGKAETPKERRAVAKIEMVSRQCTRLENLLNDFSFNKVSQLELTLGSLNEQIARVLDLFTAQADESHIEIVRYLDPDLPSIMLNAETLQAALVNLVKNALEATADGGQLTVRTRSHEARRGAGFDRYGCGHG